MTVTGNAPVAYTISAELRGALPVLDATIDFYSGARRAPEGA
ncbi:hypothetical protein AB0I84_45670 [Streptomyces spectabilis]